MTRHISASLLLIPLTFTLQAQQSGFLLGAGTVGIGFGDVPRVDGLRFNWSDDHFREVNGLNFTLWRPDFEFVDGSVNGISFGVVSAAGWDLNGLSVSPVSILARNSMNGIQVGGLALVSEGPINGVNVGGLAVVGQGHVTGLSTALLATVSQGDVSGISISGLATVAQGSVSGISVGGLAMVSQGDISGIAVGGLASVAQGNITGFTVSSLASVAQGNILGISVAGLAVVSESSIMGVTIGGLAVVGREEVFGCSVGGVAVVSEGNLRGVNMTLGQLYAGRRAHGLNIAAYKLDAETLKGLNLGLGWSESQNAIGITTSAYNRTYGMQKGLVIGLFNHAGDLEGAQIGLLNIVDAGPVWARILPLINVRL